VDLREVARQPWLLLAAVASLCALKAVAAALALRLTGLPAARAIEAGLLLAQGGEFAFIAIGHAAATGLLAGDVSRFAMVVVSASLFATPALARLGQAVARRLERGEAEGAQEAAAHGELQDHVLVAGCGRVGQLLAGVLARQGLPYVAVESDAHVVARLRKEGLHVVYGNAARPELLRRLAAGQARAVVITMDQPAAAMHAVRAVRADYARLPVLARARDEQHARALLQAGATFVLPETLEAALQLSGAVLQYVGMPDEAAQGVIDEEREKRLPAGPRAI
jgi:CPA2 family monovalent cation:H+ antiporter-2